MNAASDSEARPLAKADGAEGGAEADGTGAPSPKPARRTPRVIAREAMTAEILATARRHLMDRGADGLSLRAVARDVGMVSSAIYRYFASRDDLLTALLIESYNALGRAAETAAGFTPADDPMNDGPDRAAPAPAADPSGAKAAAAESSGVESFAAESSGAEPSGVEPFAAQAAAEAAAAELYGDRFVAACRAARRWAVAHPQQWALLYGSPVPGYAAPQQTIGPAARLPMALVRLAQQALEVGQISVGNSESLPPELSRQSLALAQALGTNLPDWLLFRAGECFTHLMGTISAELFGHLVGSFDPADALAEHLWRQLAGRMGFAGFAARS